ncbi:MAG: NAD-dependent deacylase [Bacteroidota bacterium]
MKKMVVLTGAGISAESGLKTFRDGDGLWEGHDITQVATPEAWQRDPALVLAFYNQRRRQAATASPNAGHLALKELESHFEVVIITQNIDSLHEKAGSSKVIHLHGEIGKARSTKNPAAIIELAGTELNLGDLGDDGSQLRPHIVWFGEAVPMMEAAIDQVISADVFIVAGTSLVVYPAAGLVDYVKEDVPIYIVDPKIPVVNKKPNMHFIEETASTGLPRVLTKLTDNL